MPATFAPISIAPPADMSPDYVEQWWAIIAAVADAPPTAGRGPLAPPEGASEHVRRGWARAVALGVMAAVGDASARAELLAEDTEPEPLHALGVRSPVQGGLAGLGGAVLDDAEGVVLYIDQQTFGALVGIHPTYLNRLRSKGRLVEANTSVGRAWGWGIGRAVMWAIEYGYLLPSLERNPDRENMRAELDALGLDLDRRPHWRRGLVGYLTQVQVAKFLGIKDKSFHQARRRDAGPPPAIRIGSMYGWELEKVREFNMRRPVALRQRSQEPGIIPAATSGDQGESGGAEART